MNSIQTESRPDTRQHIIDCGHPLIAAKGFVAVGLAEILSAARVPKGSFYHYFPSKEAFGVALLENYEAAYVQKLAALEAQPNLTGAQRLMSYFESWIESQRGDDAARYCLIVKLSAEVSDLSSAMRDRMLAATHTVLRHLAGHIRAGQADGSIANPLDASALAQWLYEAWLGASLLSKLRCDDSAFIGAMERTRELLQLN